MARRRMRDPSLYPRSFLAGADLDLILGREARKRTMTKSQLIRHLLIKQLQYDQIKGADRLTDGEDDV